MVDLKSMVAGDKQVHFIYYKDECLWYRTDNGYQFPVPICDIGSATFLATDKAMLFMRYIRKQLQADVAQAKMIEEARQEALTEALVDGRPSVEKRSDEDA